MEEMRSEFVRDNAQLVQELQRMERRLERVEAEEAAARTPLQSPYNQLRQMAPVIGTLPVGQFYVQPAQVPPAMAAQQIPYPQLQPLQAVMEGQQQPLVGQPLVSLGMPTMSAQQALA